MQNALGVFIIFCKLVFFFINMKMEKDAEIKNKKASAYKEAQDAIQSGDDSALTSAFDKLSRL